MRKMIALCLWSLAALGIGSLPMPGRALAADEAIEKEPRLAHSVYFSLNDNSLAAKEKLIAACKKYLSGHPGQPILRRRAYWPKT